MKDWILEDLGAEKLPAIADLSASYYGTQDDTAHTSYLDYYYSQNPAGRAITQIAWNEDKQEAAGGYSLSPVHIKMGDREELCVLSGNSLTGTAYRGQGVYTAMIQRAYQRAADMGSFMVYGMPNPNSHPIHAKLGLFEDVGRIPLYLRPLRPSGMVRSYLKSNVLSTIVRPFDGLFCPRPLSGVSFLELTNENLELADEFWSRVKDKYPIMVARDSTRLAYRFLNIPRRQYQCWYAMEDGRPVAFAIGRKMEVAGIQCAMLADFLCLDGYEVRAKGLVRWVIGKLRKDGADMAGCLMLPHTQEAKLLKQMGFFRCPAFMEPQPFVLCIHVFQERDHAADVRDIRKWFYVMGDYDVI